MLRVALLAEGVDRNIISGSISPSAYVALLAEGVDRNYSPALYCLAKPRSPSSQRAWIEMLYCCIAV